MATSRDPTVDNHLTMISTLSPNPDHHSNSLVPAVPAKDKDEAITPSALHDSDLGPSPSPSPVPAPAPTGLRKKLALSPNRLLSLDLLRGLAILLMIVCNSQSGEEVFDILEHPSWIGFTIADSIFPSFLFISGVAIPLALRAPVLGSKEAPHFYRNQFLRIFKRALTIMILGYILNLYGLVQLHAPVDQFRWPGVLQRIGFCYGIVAWMHLAILWRGKKPDAPRSLAHFAPSSSRQVEDEVDSKAVQNEKPVVKESPWPWFAQVTLPYWLPVGCLLIWLICTYSGVQVEGCPEPGMIHVAECSPQAYFDLKIFGKDHTYQHKAFDPEGALSTLTSILSVWFGWFVGCTVLALNAQTKKLTTDFKARRENIKDERAVLEDRALEQEVLTRVYLEHLGQWFWWGVLWMFVGWLFSLGLPLSKPSWTATFAVMTAGLSQVVLAVLFFKFDAQPKMQGLDQIHAEGRSSFYTSPSQDPERAESALNVALSRSRHSGALNLYYKLDNLCRYWFRRALLLVLGSMGRNAILLYMCSELVLGTCSLIPGGPADAEGEVPSLCGAAFEHTWGSLNIGGWGSLFYSLGFAALHVLLAIFLDHKKWYFKV